MSILRLFLLSSLLLFSLALLGQDTRVRQARIRELAEAGDLEERARQLDHLLRDSPRAALEAALSPQESDRLRQARPEASRYIEVWGEWAGVAGVIVRDGVEGGPNDRLISIRTENGELSVYLTTQAPHLKCGDTLRVAGIRLGSAIGGSVSAVTPAPAAAACSTTGPQKLVVLLLNFPNQSLPPSIDVASIQQSVGVAAGSVSAYYHEASYGRSDISADVFGPFTLGQSYACGQNRQILDGAIDAVDGVINLTGYTRLVLVFPGNCGAAGSIGCGTYNSPSHGSFTASASWIGSDWAGSPSLFRCGLIHELGHNYGLMHAGSLDYGSVPLGALGDKGTFSEYGDYFSQMGLCLSVDGTYLAGHFSAEEKHQLGWLAPSNVQDVEMSSSHTVLPLEVPTSGLQALRIRRGAGNNRWLWIEYRQPIGFDAPFSMSGYSTQVTSGALIHYEDPDDSTWPNYSRLLNYTASSHPGTFQYPALIPGANWTDPYSNLSLAVTGASGSGLNITVSYGTPCAILSPMSISHSPGAATGSVVVSAPADCSWTAVSNTPWITITGTAAGTGNGTVKYSITANPDANLRSGTITIGQQNVTITQSSTNNPPTPTSITPSAGSSAVDASQVFDSVFTDLDGAITFNSVRLLFNSSTSTANACLIEYVRASNQLRLYGDNPTYYSYTAPGSNITLSSSNNQCSIAAGMSSVSISGNTLTLRLSMRFTNSFAGPKTIYARAVDIAGGDSGLVPIGSWTIGQTVNSAPVVTSATPTSGSTAKQSFEFRFSDANGAADLNILNILVNNALDGRHACYLAYVRPQNLLYLVNDTGTALLPAITLGGSGSTSNSQCSINAAGSSATIAANTLILTVDLTFSSAFGGNKIIYLAARDVAEANSGWASSGVWQVPGAPPTSPNVLSPTLPRITSQSAILSLSYADLQGATDLNVINVLINSALDGTAACYVAYVRPTNTLYLVNDLGTALLPGVSLGNSSTVSNSQCTVDALASRAVVNGDQLTLELAVTTASPAFRGNRVIYTAARDTVENNSGWQAVGTWSVP